MLPLIDQCSAKSLFEFLRSHKIGQPLRSLNTMAPHGRGYRGLNVIHEWDYQALFECRLTSSGATSVTTDTKQDLMGNSRREIAQVRLGLRSNLRIPNIRKFDSYRIVSNINI